MVSYAIFPQCLEPLRESLATTKHNIFEPVRRGVHVGMVHVFRSIRRNPLAVMQNLPPCDDAFHQVAKIVPKMTRTVNHTAQFLDGPLVVVRVRQPKNAGDVKAGVSAHHLHHHLIRVLDRR